MRFLCGREPDQDATFVADATDEIPVVTESKQYAGAEPRLDPCPLCRGTQGALLFRLPFEQVWGPHSIDRHGEFLSLYRCRSCALEWFSPVGAGSGQLYADMDREGAYYEDTKWEFELVASRVTSDLSVLDLGCGEGAFLRRVRGSVAHVAGYDFNPDALGRVAADGIETFSGDLAVVAAANIERFDLITAFHVLEHLDDVTRFVKAGAQMLEPGGAFVVSMPNRDRLRLDDIEPLDFPPHHASRWSDAQLVRLGEEAGLSLREVRHEPTHIHTRVHILARRLARLARQRGSTPLGAPAFTDQVRNRDRGFALLAVYGRS